MQISCQLRIEPVELVPQALAGCINTDHVFIGSWRLKIAHNALKVLRGNHEFALGSDHVRRRHAGLEALLNHLRCGCDVDKLCSGASGLGELMNRRPIPATKMNAVKDDTDLSWQELEGKLIHDLAGEQPRLQSIPQPERICGQDQQWVAARKMIGDCCLARTRNAKEANKDWLCPAFMGKCQIGKHLGGKPCDVHGLYTIPWLVRLPRAQRPRQ